MTWFFRCRGEPCRDCYDLRTNACWLGQALPLVQSSPCFSATFPPLSLPSSGVVGLCTPLVLLFQFLGLKTWWILESQRRFAQSGFSPSSPKYMEHLVALGCVRRRLERRCGVDQIVSAPIPKWTDRSAESLLLRCAVLCMIYSPVICLVCYSHRVRIWETVRT